jgi:hypothetical protein
VTIQVTPAFLESFVTITPNVAVVPTVTVVGAPVIATEMTLLEFEPPPQPATTSAIAKYKKNFT